jgi:adenylate cyclase
VAEERVQRRLAAVVAADVVGYSRLMEADEAGTRAHIRALQTEIIDPLVSGDGGRVVKTMGDGVLIEFPSAVDAVRNALSVQQAMARRNDGVADLDRIEFRVGINVGDLIIEGDDIHGDGVNIAARLEAICEPGSVYVSSTVREHVEGKLVAVFEDLGEHSLKNITRPVQVFCVHDGISRARTREAIAPAAQISPAANKPSIAVLPFNNMSGDPEQEYFSDGISEDIITALSHIRQFFVVARNTTFTYKGRAVDVQAVASELGVRYVLEGSVRKAGNRVRITAQLIEAATGNHLWADRYDRELEDIFDIQDQITQTVAGAMAPELGRAEQQRALAKPPDNLDAWDLYQRGLFHTYKRNREDNAEALIFFRKAIEQDQNFAGPHSGMVRAQITDILLEYREHDPKEILRSAQQAVRLDDQDSKSYYAMGVTHVMALHDGEAAIRAFEEGLKIDPNDAQILCMLAKALICQGRATEALEKAEQSIRLSPADQNIGIFYGSLSLACLSLQRHEEAVEWARKTHQRTGSWFEWITLPSALAHLGHTDDARRTCDELAVISPNLTVSVVGRRQPITHAPYMDHLLDGLRKAGMAE